MCDQTECQTRCNLQNLGCKTRFLPRALPKKLRKMEIKTGGRKAEAANVNEETREKAKG